MLLHSPALARGWNVFLGAVRSELALDPKLHELAMCVVAVLNDAEYEYLHHAPLYVQAGGSQRQVAALRDPDSALLDATLFDEVQRAAIVLTVEMTRDVRVSPATMEAVLRKLPERETVELVGVVSTYNMVSRFLVALGVEQE
jgi:alkylhydroperoxidase family enzyme